MRRQASVSAIVKSHSQQTDNLHANYQEQLRELNATHEKKMLGSRRPEEIEQLVRDHEDERKKLISMHKKEEKEYKLHMSTMRHADSVAQLINTHDIQSSEREKELVEKNERLLQLEQNTTRELNNNLNQAQIDIQRLEQELKISKTSGDEKKESEILLSLKLKKACDERDATQTELTLQLKREQKAHETTLFKSNQLESDLIQEHADKLQKEKEIQNIQQFLDDAKKDTSKTKEELQIWKKEKMKLEIAQANLLAESAVKSTNISELQTKLVETQNSKSTALEKMRNEAIATTNELHLLIQDEKNSATMDHEKMLNLQTDFANQLEKERIARCAIEKETAAVKQERDDKEEQRQILLNQVKLLQSKDKNVDQQMQELHNNLNLEQKENDKLRTSNNQKLKEMEMELENRNGLTIQLSNEEKRRKETELALNALQNQQATTKEEAAKHLGTFKIEKLKI